MKSTHRLLVLTFLGSFAVISIERGVYFYTASRLGFSDATNLLLALLFGLAYVAGSLGSHAVSRRFGEKRTLTGVIGLQLLLHVVLAVWPAGAVFWSLDPLAGVLYGMQWPIIESYVSAGRSSRSTHRIIGIFNMSWAAAVPLNLATAGPIIQHWPTGLFLLPAWLNAVMLWLIRPLPLSPPRLTDDHPHRPPEAERARLRALLASHRWVLVLAYACMFVLAPLLPGVYRQLGLPVQTSAALSGLLDVLRVAAFLALWLYPGWHGRVWPAIAAVTLLPIGFFLSLFGGRLDLVLFGEVLFGLANGFAYYGALHYAQLVHNAAVEAGGAHEGLIGTGFALGPLAGLAGIAIAPAFRHAWPGMSPTDAELLGTLSTLGPLFVLCSAGALLVLRSLPRRQ